MVDVELLPSASRSGERGGHALAGRPAGEFIVWDIDENLATKAELQGGSKIVCEIYVDDVLTETQEFS